jgi:membrane-bound serine protease (ClpP class)
MIWIIVLMVAGFAFILAEIFLPGMIAGILGMLLLLGSLVSASMQFGSVGVLWTLLVEMVLGFIIFLLWMKYFPQSRFGRAFSLPDPDSQKSYLESSRWIGRSGIAITPLRPAGVARIDGQRLDVTTEGQHIPANAEVTVVKVAGAAIFVRANTIHSPNQES